MRLHNFSAGPAVLPLPVLMELRENLADFNGTGIGLMEMSHRSAEFIDIAERADHDDQGR